MGNKLQLTRKISSAPITKFLRKPLLIASRKIVVDVLNEFEAKYFDSNNFQRVPTISVTNQNRILL